MGRKVNYIRLGHLAYDFSFGVLTTCNGIRFETVRQFSELLVRHLVGTVKFAMVHQD